MYVVYILNFIHNRIFKFFLFCSKMHTPLSLILFLFLLFNIVNKDFSSFLAYSIIYFDLDLGFCSAVFSSHL